MAEDIYNIYLVMENDVCRSARYVVHRLSFDTDDEAVAFLRARVEGDLVDSVVFPIARQFTLSEYYSHIRLGQGMALYDDLLQALKASVSPLCVTTLVVDDRVRVDHASEHGDPDIYLNPQVLGGTKMDDWLLKYTSDTSIDLTQLIHDDYFTAIKLTYNAKLYVSAMKLLLSCLDSVSYIEYGDKGTPFVRWLDDFADLSRLGVTSKELWELRNGLLHMTNLQSRQVRNQKTRRISFRIGGKPGEADSIYYFVFSDLIDAYGKAIGRWLGSYNTDRAKFVKFVERYDETISDSRFAVSPAVSP
ncbi:hypothetical protein [Stappia indica]|uniref:Uncharacterized protein n=1 Tax=Stappia indica TaxID=538381 RepID=A0A857CB59_9HYPH|nr:hypothetical protein [Stappia indica]QGZ35682.1 hypothetical protein GH266_14970 [Stappia indica]